MTCLVLSTKMGKVYWILVHNIMCYHETSVFNTNAYCCSYLPDQNGISIQASYLISRIFVSGSTLKFDRVPFFDFTENNFNAYRYESAIESCSGRNAEYKKRTGQSKTLVQWTVVMGLIACIRPSFNLFVYLRQWHKSPHPTKYDCGHFYLCIIVILM